MVKPAWKFQGLLLHMLRLNIRAETNFPTCIWFNPFWGQKQPFLTQKTATKTTAGKICLRAEKYLLGSYLAPYKIPFWYEQIQNHTAKPLHYTILHTPYFEPNFQENGWESAKTIRKGIVQQEILYHFSFDTIGKKPFFNFFFEKNRKYPYE